MGFRPFEQVLVRDNKDEVWNADLFNRYNDNEKDYEYVCVGSKWNYCIPFKGNECLLGTNKNTLKLKEIIIY